MADVKLSLCCICEKILEEKEKVAYGNRCEDCWAKPAKGRGADDHYKRRDRRSSETAKGVYYGKRI